MAPQIPKPTSVQRSRLFGIETSEEFVVFSAATTPVLIAKYEGRNDVEIASDLPVYWFDNDARTRVLATGGWEVALTKIAGFDLLAISPNTWNAETVMVALKKLSPSVEPVR